MIRVIDLSYRVILKKYSATYDPTKSLNKLFLCGSTFTTIGTTTMPIHAQHESRQQHIAYPPYFEPVTKHNTRSLHATHTPQTHDTPLVTSPASPMKNDFYITNATLFFPSRPHATTITLHYAPNSFTHHQSPTNPLSTSASQSPHNL